jgi:hypothetical protein
VFGKCSIFLPTQIITIDFEIWVQCL